MLNVATQSRYGRLVRNAKAPRLPLATDVLDSTTQQTCTLGKNNGKGNRPSETSRAAKRTNHTAQIKAVPKHGRRQAIRTISSAFTSCQDPIREILGINILHPRRPYTIKLQSRKAL